MKNIEESFVRQLGGEKLYKRCFKKDEYGDIVCAREALGEIGKYIKAHPEKRQETLDYIENNILTCKDDIQLFMAAFKADYCEDNNELKEFVSKEDSIFWDNIIEDNIFTFDGFYNNTFTFDGFDDSIIESLYSRVKKEEDSYNKFNIYKSILYIKPTENNIKRVLKQASAENFSIYQKSDMLSLLIEKTSDEKILDFIAQQKEELYKNCNDDNRKCILDLEEAFRNKNYIQNTLNKKYPNLSIEEQILQAAHDAQTSEKKKESFYNFLLSEGEEKVLEIDTKVMQYLVDNFTQTNLDAVNDLKKFYGLKVCIEEGDYASGDENSAKRLEFDGMISSIDDKKYYELLHTEEFKNLKTDRRRKYKWYDYAEVEKSSAFKTLKKYNFDALINVAIDSFISEHISPEAAKKFNIKDIYEVILKATGEQDIFDCDGEWLFTKTRFPLEELGANWDNMDARSQFWMDLTDNPKIMNAISEDLKRKGIDADDIKRIWMNALKGNPQGYGGYRVRSISFQIHHNKALKDGGENTPNNFVVVTGFSHKFLHQQDNPLVILYENKEAKNPDDKIITTTPLTLDAKRVRLRIGFVNETVHQKVRYYGGPRKQSIYKGELKNMTNVAEATKKAVKENKKKEEKIDILSEIIRKNIEKQIKSI